MRSVRARIRAIARHTSVFAIVPGCTGDGLGSADGLIILLGRALRPCVGARARPLSTPACAESRTQFSSRVMLQELPQLAPGQYILVYNMFSFTIATMAAAFVFFVMAQKNIAPKYRISMMISALVVFIAGYHYFRIFNSWEHAFALNQSMGMYEPTGDLFNDAYRYVDWLLTVPLLVVELVLVMDLPEGESGPLAAKLGFAAAFMIILGYPGEASTSTDFFGYRGLWGFLSTLPFLYILYVLFTGLGDILEQQSGKVATLIRNARLLLFATWGFYPIVYMVPMFVSGYPTNAPATVITLQVGYTIADILAKAGYGVLIYHIARQKSIEEGFDVGEYVTPAAAQA